jgi:hypothetical protein
MASTPRHVWENLFAGDDLGEYEGDDVAAQIDARFGSLRREMRQFTGAMHHTLLAALQTGVQPSVQELKTIVKVGVEVGGSVLCCCLF